MSIFRTAAFSFATTAALGLATFTFVMPAHAATRAATSAPADTFQHVDGEPPMIRVSYADLDLNSEQGRRAMRHRLASAVDMVCSQANDLPDRLKARIAYTNCREEAMDKAMTHFVATLKEKKLAQR